MSLFSTPRCFLGSVDGVHGLRLGPISLEGSLDEKSLLPVYGFLTHDFKVHENPWTPVAKSCFCYVFVALAQVLPHPPRP